MNLDEKIKIFKEKIKSAKNILVVGHLRPDGDAISSVCIILEILKRFKKEAFAYCHGNIPSSLSYLNHFEKIDNTLEDFNKYDLLIVVDCGSLLRTNLSKEIKKAKELNSLYIIEIDHHPLVDFYSDLEIRDTKAASTTEILYYICKELEILIDKSLAEAILTGIITDTGNFFYPNASSKSLQIASNLLNKGANLAKIIKHNNSSYNLASYKLWGLAMERLEVHHKYDLAYSVLRLDDILAISSDSEEISETLSLIAGFLSNLSGVKATLLLHETKKGMIKGHLRSSRKDIDISKLARYLGGGGHKQAAGFAIAGEIVKIDNSWQIK